MSPINESAEWRALVKHAEEIKDVHLRDLLQDPARTAALTAELGDVTLDLSRQNATEETLSLLLALARRADVAGKTAALFGGARINASEDRAVLHVALRAPRDARIPEVGGVDNVVPGVWEVLDRIRAFSDEIRSGKRVGATGKALTDVVAIGIGGSALGPLFVHTALSTDAGAAAGAAGRRLRFLANVDPVDAVRALEGLDPATTLAIVVSKTFTTAETMLNARTVRAWLAGALGEGAIAQHMVAVSTNLQAVAAFGIDPANAFGFWDWVGGRYSVSSAVGVLPLTLQYGWEPVEAFLQGMHAADEHFRTAPPEKNLPLLMGLFNVWNATFLGRSTTALLPYQQALQHFAPHVQQLSMESNGKGVGLDGRRLPYAAGEIDFGEPGTNGQHSFYQLLHQGRVVPAEFIAAARSQQDVYLGGEKVSSHEELMANFFAQPDALALGKGEAELRAEGVPPHLIPHKTFTGNRPSLSLLLPELDPHHLGLLLGLYEHRVAASGFLWGINSFDQWGVELGKALANRVRTALVDLRAANRPASVATDGFNPSSSALINRFLKLSAVLPPPEGGNTFPPGLRRQG